MKRNHGIYLFLICLALLLAACEPVAGTGRGFLFIWYVSTTGSDANSCEAPDIACSTLEGALDRARSASSRTLEDAAFGETVTILHTINVAAGEYLVPGVHEGFDPYATVDLNVTISGSGRSSTIFSAPNFWVGLFINADVNVTLRNFTIRDLAGTGSCIDIRGSAVVSIEDVIVRNCQRTGISHIGTRMVTLTDVRVAVNLSDSAGSHGEGVFSTGDLTIEGGRFFRNEGIGIASTGNLIMNGGVVDYNDSDGMMIAGEATIDGVQFTNNGRDDTFPAGLTVNGDATVTNSTITNNGYGVRVNDEGNLQLGNSVVSINPRTGLIIFGELRMTGTTVEGNGLSSVGTGLGGGIEIMEGGQATLSNSRFSGNHNGGVLNYGDLLMADVSVTGNNGGLPAVFNATGSNALIRRSLIANNTRTGEVAVGDDAVNNVGTLEIINSTISGNDGNGLNTIGRLTLSFATIALNENVGLVISEAADVPPTLMGNLIAGNGTDCYIPGPGGPGAAILDGPSMDGDGSCDFPLSSPIATLRLGPLADNGGLTQTHALLPGSPAIDTMVGIGCPDEDQRVYVRPGGERCDPGAYEAAAVAMTPGATPLAAVTPVQGEITAIVIQNARCRTGPGLVYEDHDFFDTNQKLVVNGRNADLSWFRVIAVTLPGNCWIGGGVLEFSVSKEGLLVLPVLPAPPTPTATLDPDEEYDATPSPTGTCYYDKNQNYICP